MQKTKNTWNFKTYYCVHLWPYDLVYVYILYKFIKIKYILCGFLLIYTTHFKMFVEMKLKDNMYFLWSFWRSFKFYTCLFKKMSFMKKTWTCLVYFPKYVFFMKRQLQEIAIFIWHKLLPLRKFQCSHHCFVLHSFSIMRLLVKL